MNRPEVIAAHVSKGFELCETIQLGWYRRLDPRTCTIDDIYLAFGQGNRHPSSVGYERIGHAIAEVVRKAPSSLDWWMFGLSAEPAWVKQKYLVAEWRRQIAHAQRTGAAPPAERPDEELLECARCGAPRWDNETVRRVRGEIVCDPRCP